MIRFLINFFIFRIFNQLWHNFKIEGLDHIFLDIVGNVSLERRHIKGMVGTFLPKYFYSVNNQYLSSLSWELIIKYIITLSAFYLHQWLYKSVSNRTVHCLYSLSQCFKIQLILWGWNKLCATIRYETMGGGRFEAGGTILNRERWKST